MKKTLKKPNILNRINKVQFFSIFILLFLSIIFVYSTSIYDSINNNLESPYISFIKQVVFVLLGLAAYFICLLIPIKFYSKNAKNIAFISILLILLTFLFSARNGAHRWIELGSFTVQPSEITKISLIILWSKYLSKYATYFNKDNKKKDKKNTLSKIIKFFNFPLLLTLLCLILFRLQSDNGSLILSLSVIIILIFSSGLLSKKYNLIFCILLLTCVFFIIVLYIYIANLDKSYLNLLATKTDKYNYVLGRFIAWVNPFLSYSDSGYQIVNSMIAIANGGLFGKGIGNGIQKQGFLSEGYNDFIISNIAEEIGLVGVILIYFLYITIILEGYRIAQKNKNMFSYLLSIGIITLFFIQIFWNVAGIIGVLPMKGLTAPLLSYGGTSLIITLFSLGIIQRINIEQKTKNYA